MEKTKKEIREVEWNEKKVNPKEFGERIRIARQAARLSQSELGKVVGVSDRSISSYEKGRTLPPLNNLKKISETTNYPLRFFIGEPDRMDTVAQLMRNIERELKEIRELLDQNN